MCEPFYGLVPLLILGTAFTMDNRHNPNRPKPVRRRSVAHQEAKDLEAFIMEKRLEYSNSTVDGESGDQGHIRGKYGYFPWETEVDKEWETPFLPREQWITLPHNQNYDRRAWFSAFNDSQVQSLLHAGRGVRFVFALSTGERMRQMFTITFCET